MTAAAELFAGVGEDAAPPRSWWLVSLRDSLRYGRP
jgi:hypothetical protein